MKIKASHLKHLKCNQLNNEFQVALIDLQGYEILKGYGKTIEEAINDLHNNLI